MKILFLALLLCVSCAPNEVIRWRNLGVVQSVSGQLTQDWNHARSIVWFVRTNKTLAAVSDEQPPAVGDTLYYKTNLHEPYLNEYWWRGK